MTANHKSTAMLHQIRVALLALGSATKGELCEKVDISFPTITKLIDQMEKSGEVTNLGFDESSGGRPAQRYLYNPDYMLGLAIFLERNETVFTVFNCLGEVKKQGTYKSVLGENLSLLKGLITDILSAFPSICSIAFGVPGAVENGKIFYIPDYSGFHDVDLQAVIEEEFSLSVVVENDMNAAVLGYHHRNDMEKKQSSVYILAGNNGPGAGLFVNGDVVRGKSFFTGEVSFTPIGGEQTFYEALQGGKREQEEAISRLVAMMTVMINPHTIIFNKEEMEQSMLERINMLAASFVPKEHLPDLKTSDWKEDYLHGLKFLAVERMLRQ